MALFILPFYKATQREEPVEGECSDFWDTSEELDCRADWKESLPCVGLCLIFSLLFISPSLIPDSLKHHILSRSWACRAALTPLLEVAPLPLHFCHCFFSLQHCLYTLLCYTSFSDELADRSTSWASKNSETDSDMESRLSLEACWVSGIPICSPACRRAHANPWDDAIMTAKTDLT